MFHYHVGGNTLCFQSNCNIETVMCSTQYSRFYIVIALDKTQEERQWGLQNHFQPWVCHFACISFLLALSVLPYSTSSLTQRLTFTYGHITRYRCLCAAKASVLCLIKINNSNKKLNTVGLYPAVVLMRGKRSLRVPSMRVWASSYRLMSGEIKFKAWSQSNSHCSHCMQISRLCFCP